MAQMSNDPILNIRDNFTEQTVLEETVGSSMRMLHYGKACQR